MSDETYNGWTNRETQAVNVSVISLEGLADYFNDYALEIKDMSPDEQVIAMASYIEEWFISQYLLLSEQRCDSRTAQALLDIGSLWRVNWQELAQSFLDY